MLWVLEPPIPPAPEEPAPPAPPPPPPRMVGLEPPAAPSLP